MVAFTSDRTPRHVFAAKTGDSQLKYAPCDHLPSPTRYHCVEFRAAYALGSLAAVIGSALLRPFRQSERKRLPPFFRTVSHEPMDKSQQF